MILFHKSDPNKKYKKRDDTVQGGNERIEIHWLIYGK